jgi:hypothetical protein
VVAIQAMVAVAVVGAVLALPVVPVVVNAQRLAAAAMVVVVAVTVAEPVVVVSLRVPQGLGLSYPAAVGHALRRETATNSVMNI